MDNYLAYFCLRTQRGVNNIRETDVLTKIGEANVPSWVQAETKRGTGPL